MITCLSRNFRLEGGRAGKIEERLSAELGEFGHHVEIIIIQAFMAAIKFYGSWIVSESTTDSTTPVDRFAPKNKPSLDFFFVAWINANQ